MSIINVDRAIHELRCGRAVNIGGVGVLHPEYIIPTSLKKLKNAKLLVTATRAGVITGKKFKAIAEVSADKLTLGDTQEIVEGKYEKKISFAENKTKTAEAAIELGKLAQVLPVAITFENPGKDLYKVTSKDILSFRQKSVEQLQLVADAPLKLCSAPTARIKAYRTKNGTTEHLAIIIGTLTKEPLIRIHSSCYTGDLLGSLTCDCGDQLKGTIKLMHKEGGGVILYLMQEGRGIGLINKLKAYKLQSEGLDTVEANEFLGFDDEERSFGPAIKILGDLGIRKAKIVTNNPKKVQALEKFGIKITGRIPLIVQHEHNEKYLKIKSSKSGHLI